MNKLYQDNGMYCRAQNQCDNKWFVGTYIGNEWLLFPRTDNTAVYGCQIKPESVCRSTGRENEFEYDVIQLVDDDEDVYLIIYNDEDLAWQMLSVYGSDMIDLGKSSPVNMLNLAISKKMIIGERNGKDRMKKENNKVFTYGQLEELRDSLTLPMNEVESNKQDHILRKYYNICSLLDMFQLTKPLVDELKCQPIAARYFVFRYGTNW